MQGKTKFGNSRRKILNEQKAQEEHNLFCYSSNVLCSAPKIGYETEWGNTAERLRVFTQMLNELPDENGISVYIGRILRSFNSEEGHIICFEISGSEEQYGEKSMLCMFHIPEQLHNEFMPTYYTVYDERKNTGMTDLVEMKVKLNVIQEIGWVEE